MTSQTSEISKPVRIVDAHVHLWDPSHADWYPYLSTNQASLNMGDVSGMARRFDVPTYMAEATDWNVEKIVNVAAAIGRHSIDETLELDGLADATGHPAAIIGGLPPAGSVADAVAAIDRQMEASRFRGVRPIRTSEAALPPDDVLCALAERGLIYEVIAHPDQLVAAAKGIEKYDDLVVVVEHTGWLRGGLDEERALWTEGINALAGLGANVVCKLSGLAMALGSMTVEAMAPWLDYAIEAFGTDRCLFASNFPVDGMHGSLDQLWTAYSRIAGRLSADDRDKLFAANAERIYRC